MNKFFKLHNEMQAAMKLVQCFNALNVLKIQYYKPCVPTMQCFTRPISLKESKQLVPVCTCLCTTINAVTF